MSQNYTTRDINNNRGLIIFGNNNEQYQAGRDLIIKVPYARRIQRVYLGTIHHDVKEYGSTIRNVLVNNDALLDVAGARGGNPADEMSHANLGQATGFIGLLGYWCGAGEAGLDQSISHKEFLHAQERWQGEQTPPIKMYMPQEGSTSAYEAQQRAEELLAANPAQREQCMSCYKAFYDAIVHYRLSPVYFQDRSELREYVAQVINQWRIPLMDVAEGKIEVQELEGITSSRMDQLLGTLGRKRHIQIAKDVLAALKSDANAPAVALLVYGNKDAGRRIFLDHLLALKLFRTGRRGKRGSRPALEQYHQEELTRWIGNALGYQAETPEVLADLVHGELLKQQMTFVVDPIDGLLGGLAVFQEQFWQPFYSRLQQLNRHRKAPNRLIAIICAQTSELDQAVLADCTESLANPTTDFVKLFKLPVLGLISKGDLRQWLEDDLSLTDLTENSWAELLKRVLTDDDGQPLETPAIVYERLRNEDVWSEVQNNE